jgi:hypothetical protein
MLLLPAAVIAEWASARQLLVAVALHQRVAPFGCPSRRLLAGAQRKVVGGLTGLTQMDPASIVMARPKPSGSGANWR